jgi:hypothetical protein
MSRAISLAAAILLLWAVGYSRPTSASVPARLDAYCGDSICQDWGCDYNGNETPGNGCNENIGNCPVDCGGAGCGDDYCDCNNENYDNCPADCSENACVYNDVAQTTVRFTSDDSTYGWSQRFTNYPQQGYVGECYGNCGPGCSEFGSSPGYGICAPGSETEQYWEMEELSSPTYYSYYGCFCSGVGEEDCGTYDGYTVDARWTYHGWTAAGCYDHDTSCRTPGWVSILAVIVGEFAPGIGTAIAGELLLNPFASCHLA